MSRPVVVKIGGTVMNDLSTLWEQIQFIKSPVVIVHGGGSQSTKLANQLGHSPRIIHGRRVTTDLDLNIAEWVMRGSVNVSLVAQANINGLHAVGLCGVDGRMIDVQRREPWIIDGETVDFGWVGEIIDVNTTVIDQLSDAGFTCIIAPIGYDHTGQRFNINADTVACALAEHLVASDLVFVTDTGGVMKDLSDPYSRLITCSPDDEIEGVNHGWISGGMSVKLQMARNALNHGVSKVWITGVRDVLYKINATEIIA
ncbi:MAG: acetylglutamate kinase [Bacteroidetes bacterium]|nr:acetylglutamate kinase [Bacteroidota bacterium]